MASAYNKTKATIVQGENAPDNNKSDNSDDDGNVDFDTQLRLEQEEAAAKATKSSSEDKDSAGKTRTDEDGTVYDWDEAKSAWFPRIDAEMMLRYQLGYGVDTTAAADESVVQPTPPQFGGAEFDSLTPEEQESARQYWDEYYSSEEYREWYRRYTEGETQQQERQEQEDKQKVEEQNRKREQKRKSSEQQHEWFEVSAEQNTHVYVQNLPLSMTEPEFIEFMSKCGMVLHDPLTRKPKVKLYKDSEGRFNGDARCGYIKRESVSLAVQILDGYRLGDNEISVEPAKFQAKAGYDPSKRRRLTNKEKKKIKEQQTRLLAWMPADSAAASADGGGAGVARRSDRVLVVSNVFEPSEFDSQPLLVERIRVDLTERCAQFGEVKKVTLHDRNPSGVVSVTFSQATECGLALTQLNGRVFRGRVLTAAVWDGRTKYHVEETPEEAAKRREIWEKQVLGEVEEDTKVDKPATEEVVIDQSVESIQQQPQPSLSIEQRVESIDRPVESIDQHVESIDQHVESAKRPVESIDQHVESIDQHVESIDRHVESIDRIVASMEHQDEGSTDVEPVASEDSDENL